ncbi:MAG: sensor histidine kinase [Synergistaceae bacterium]|jgi:signal transduction histidine kinase|nr:sensor histidine kinase [Synergistaceae bacterium]
MKKRLLFILMFLVTLLSALNLFVTIYAGREQEEAMNSMMRSYVMELAEGFNSGGSQATSYSLYSERRNPFGGRSLMHFRMLSTAPVTQNAEQGGVLVLTKDRRILTASPGAEKLLDLWEGDLAARGPTEVQGAGGNSYYMATRELDGGIYALAAVSKSRLLQPVTGFWRFGMIAASAMSALLLLGMFALWKYLVAPLRGVAEAIANMKWGKELPALPSGAVLFEIGALSEAIRELAAGAMAREDLKVRYIGDLVQVQEDARRRLARDLHDGPLQGAVAAIKRIQLARESLKRLDDPATTPGEHLETAENVSQEVAGEIRGFCDELSPSWVKLGLKSAMYENADRLAAFYGVEIDVEMTPEMDLNMDMDADVPEEHVLALVRILQEAVSNSVRHGESRHIRVSLHENEGELHFTIEDDGRGFHVEKESDTDYEHLRATGHRGLSNMYERVQLLRGTIRIRSASGRGCILDIRFPVKDCQN